MAYSAPTLYLPVVLRPGYVVPGWRVPVVLGDGDAPRVDAHLLVDLPAPPIPDLGLSAEGDQIQPMALAAELPAPVPALQLIARERAYPLSLHAALPAPDPALVLDARGVMVQRGGMVVALPAPQPLMSLSMLAQQLIDLPDADGANATTLQQSAERTEVGSVARQAAMLPARAAAHAAHTSAMPVSSGVQADQQAMLRLRAAGRIRHAQAIRRRAGAGARHAQCVPLRRAVRAPHADALAINAGTAARHADTLKPGAWLAEQHQHGELAAMWTLLAQASGTRRPVRLHVQWAQGIAPEPGRWWPVYDPPGLRVVLDASPYLPRPLHCAVVLGAGYPVQPYCPVEPPKQPDRIPVQEVYVVSNSFSLVRVDNAAPLAALSFAASIDVDSWCWGWSASIPASQLDLVRSSTPGEWVELLASVNGTQLRLTVEKIARERQFGSGSVRISGRGRAAWLADPMAPVISRSNSEIRTARQLLDEALTLNGVPIGWDLDWQLTDWQVAAGSWSHTGTAMDAALRIAEAGGGYVQADDTAQTLHLLPRYPLLPWVWAGATPDIVLPEDVVTVEGIEWLDKPAYNAVYIAGGEGGRLDKIRRAGTAGDITAPTIVDALATAPEMTRARGGVVLADAGRQAHITLKLPVMSPVGVIKPGKLVRYTEQGVARLGLSRAVSLDVGLPEIWQTVRLETHELQPV
ncbi:hypothetical protein ACTSKR_11270 [Chitinibacteraceae bacterium HSL-7]